VGELLRKRPTVRKLIEMDLEVYRKAVANIERSHKPDAASA
jgi:hypothetical protein